MQRYWTNSAATGDPNDDGWFAPPEWPRVGDDYERVWLLEHEVRVETSVQPECELSGDVYEAITAP